MNDFLLIDRAYFRELARQLKLAHARLSDYCRCEFCVHGEKMGVPVPELPG